MTADRGHDSSVRLPLADVTLIDQICDRFEDAWRNGRQPRLGDYLEAVEEPLKSHLFEELLLSDLTFRTRDETTVDAGDYLSRFPERGDQIRRVIERFWCDGSVRGDTVGVTAADRPAVRAEWAELATFQQCGKYELQGEIARGGMGIVFQARDTQLQRRVALKMILDRHLASQEAVQRFYAEAEMAASLNHPGIVPIYDAGSHAGHLYYAMGYVEGPTLAAELRRRRFGMEEAAQLVRDLARAVDYAHQHGVVHRDLKPGNILLTHNGTPQITDFGLATRTDRSEPITIAGQILGTPGYMAPEQATGHVGQSGPAVDIYALGAVLYHMITGHPPFRTALEALVCVLEQDPVPPRVLNRAVPRDLNVICMKCLNKAPADRYRSASALADDLQRFLDGDMIHAKPLSLRRRALRWARHRPRLAAVLVTMIAFYLYHLACLASGSPESGGVFHAQTTLTVALVCAYGWIFQTLMMRPRARPSLLYWWKTTDIVVLTLFLALAADGAASPLVVIYLCMAASAGLSFDRHMVWLVTAACVVSYALVVATTGWLHPDVPNPPVRHTIPVAISIVAIGLVQYYVLRCCRVALTPYRSCE
ncbi:MAG: serine/threonine protein kinase [Planctomycetaceae bacterium]|nr:serine/threonine protein kinase [Planctomycetaceae bacterium]